MRLLSASIFSLTASFLLASLSGATPLSPPLSPPPLPAALSAVPQRVADAHAAAPLSPLPAARAASKEEAGQPHTGGSEGATTAPADASSFVAGLTPGSRILKTFDFEETTLGNYDPIPMFWNKVVGRGYPIYTDAQFVHDIYRSTRTSFRMQLDGGSVAFQFTPGKLPINPNADYYIVGFVRTSALQHARAELTGWFADEAGKLIPATETHSERWASVTGEDDWHVMSLYMPGSVVGEKGAARSLVLQMGLLQPQQLGSPLGKFELYRQDIKGAAWWDDIIVFQLPRLGISTPTVGNLFGANQKVTLNITVSDLGRDRLTATLLVQNAAGELACRQSWPLERRADQLWQKQVMLPPLPAGWYVASLDVADEKTPIIRRQTRFITTADPLPVAGQQPTMERGFGLVATQWPVEAWDELPAIARYIGVGVVKLPAWRKDMSEEALLRKDQPFDALVHGLARDNITTVASFSEVPSVLTPKLNERINDSILALLDTDPNVWKPYVSFLLARYANRVDLWELGQEQDKFYTGDARYVKLFQKTYGELASLLTTPKLVIPWNALYDFDAGQYPNTILDLRIPAVIKPAQIPAYLESFQQSKTEVFAVIEPLKAQGSGGYGRTERLADFVQRIVLARTSNPRAIFIDVPMTRENGLGHQNSQPEELLLVYRTLVRQLGGATFRRALNLHPDVQAYLFDRNGRGTLIVWSQAGREGEVKLNLALGAAPALLDTNGRLTPLPLTDGVANLAVNGTPMIIDNVDTPLAELRGSFQLGANKIPAGNGVFETNIQLMNPYAEAITGTLHIQPPQGWTIEPNIIKVSLGPGVTLKQAVTIRYPYTEFAGSKTIRASLTVDQDASGRAMQLVTYATVTSDFVEMDGFCTVTPSGDLVLQQMITNLAASPLNAQAYAMVPGMARQQRFVLDLKPGQTTIKRFVFPNAASMVGKAAALGLRQNDGKTLLTKAIPLN